MSFFWKPSQKNESISSASLHICSVDLATTNYLFDLVMKINKGIDSYGIYGDELAVEYFSVEEANEVYNELRDQLHGRHPDLIGDGVYLEDNLLFFKDAEVWVQERE